jgi:sugar (pentulose or hexulose) kinase
MVHCNNCTAELDAWVKIFGEALSLFGVKADKSEIYEKLYINAADGDADCGGICACNYLSGEHTTGIKKGSPMYSRTPESKMNLANFIRSELYSAMATLKLGMNILFEKEKVSADVILAHGGLFKVKGVAQQMLADALDTPVSVMETAGEGGAWGMALLAAFMKEDGGELGKWLTSRVFGKMKSSTLEPEKSGVDGFNKYSEHYKYLIAAEKALENYNA